MKGYFTVEVTLLFPVVFFIYIFILYIGFYQYNRCLLEQDCMRGALKGSAILQYGNEKAMQEMIMVHDEREMFKYVALRTEEPRISVGGGVVSVKMDASMYFPFSGFLPGVVDNIWEIHADAESTRQDPVFFIRLYNRLLGEEENDAESGTGKKSE